MRFFWRRDKRTAGRRAYDGLNSDERDYVERRVGRVFTGRAEHYVIPADVMMALARALMHEKDAELALGAELALHCPTISPVAAAFIQLAGRCAALHELVAAVVAEGPIGHDYLRSFGYSH